MKKDCKAGSLKDKETLQRNSRRLLTRLGLM